MFSHKLEHDRWVLRHQHCVVSPGRPSAVTLLIFLICVIVYAISVSHVLHPHMRLQFVVLHGLFPATRFAELLDLRAFAAWAQKIDSSLSIIFWSSKFS